MSSATSHQVSEYSHAAARLRAIRERDQRADAWFVYAVSTTGVYCRPSCGARIPLERNVSYFETSEAAEAAGYRPCKRCRPKEPRDTSRRALVLRARQLLEQSDTRLTLDELAERLSVSKYHLHRLFKADTKMTPLEYGAALRLNRVKQQLSGGASVTEALYAAGYSSSGRFYAESAALGMPASSLRHAARGERLRYAHAKSSLGQVLVAATERGVCWVSLGDSSAELEDEMRQRLRAASFSPPDRRVRAIAARIVRWVDAGEAAPDIPLDLAGTRFQLRVWQELARLAPGTTTTYSDLAAALGCPGAARAVGSACGDNPVALVVPCHRVIKKDGGLGGYRWGLERKRKLLTREAERQRRPR